MAKRKMLKQAVELDVKTRLLEGRKAGAKKGRHQGGTTPYGYMRDSSTKNSDGVRLILHPEEARVVKDIFTQFLKYKSITKVVSILNGAKRKTRKKNPWSTSGVRYILKNPTYLGYVHFGLIRTKGEHPAIVTPIIFNKVNVLLKPREATPL